MERKSGVIHEFNPDTGLGRVDSADGRQFGFHLTQIADGTRTIAAHTHVGFDVVAGRLGQWEAVNIEPSEHARHPLFGDVDTEPEEFEEETFACPVCSGAVEGEAGDYEICSTCNWEDDPVQSADPDFAGGANTKSLNEAKATWSNR